MKILTETSFLKKTFSQCQLLNIFYKQQLFCFESMYNRKHNNTTLIWKIGLDRATGWLFVMSRFWIHHGKTSRNSVFISKSYSKASEISLECSQYVSFENFKCNATVYLRWSLQYCRHWLPFPSNTCSILFFISVIYYICLLVNIFLRQR